MSDNNQAVNNASKALVAANRKLESIKTKATKKIAAAQAAAEKRYADKITAAEGVVAEARKALAAQLQ